MSNSPNQYENIVTYPVLTDLVNRFLIQNGLIGKHVSSEDVEIVSDNKEISVKVPRNKELTKTQIEEILLKATLSIEAFETFVKSLKIDE
jgi:hypothetical protein